MNQPVKKGREATSAASARKPSLRHTAPFPLLLPSWLDASACSPARFSREVTR